MTTGNVIDIPGDVLDVPVNVALELGKVGKWIQAVGLIVILWIVFQAITMYFNRKRRKMIEEIKEDVKRIEEKVDKLSKKRK
jgi:L-lactate permease